jgi:hypothetical protein
MRALKHCLDAQASPTTIRRTFVSFYDRQTRCAFTRITWRFRASRARPRVRIARAAARSVRAAPLVHIALTRDRVYRRILTRG